MVNGEQKIGAVGMEDNMEDGIRNEVRENIAGEGVHRIKKNIENEKAGRGKKYGDRNEMDRVREFDKKWMKMESNTILMRRMGAYFFEFLASIMVVVLCDENSWQIMHLTMACFYLFAIGMHMGIYMTIYEEMQSISIYQLLKNFPVSPGDIFKVRLSYLWKILYKRLIILYVLQLPFVVWHKGVTVIHIVYPAFVIAAAGVYCIFSIMPKSAILKNRQ